MPAIAHVAEKQGEVVVVDVHAKMLVKNAGKTVFVARKRDGWLSTGAIMARYILAASSMANVLCLSASAHSAIFFPKASQWGQIFGTNPRGCAGG